MKKQVPAKAERLRLNVLGASALLVLLAACGDHPPKDKPDGDKPPAPPPAAITLVAGNATTAGAIDATGSAARFRNPHGIAVDSAGNLYVADRGNFTIRKITASGVVTTLAGSAGDSEFINGVGGGARFSNPLALAIGPNNILYVGDYRLVRRVGTGGQVDTFSEIPRGNVDSRSTPLLDIGGIAVDTRGDVIVTNGHSTRRITQNGAITMLEGSQVLTGVGGTRAFLQRGVATDSKNDVYVYTLERTIARTNGSNTLTQLAGALNVRGYADGTGAAARFEDVVAMTVDPQGNVYAADNTNNLIRKITPDGVVSTFAGTLKATTLATGALPGSLPNIQGLTTDGKGSLYATTGNAVIKIRLP
ncbi:hypothetical protein [Massilia sp. H6]|uniref:NHL domain-containing protein n=1 Tax=Massilia sp. H6 TaxID=2970464 RepID=UPI002168F6E4|nr:hypothetical protein [Massilia sp. H6]UVW30473.1 hypothetical protein NRS07_00045 [Massilia sp. H6]